MTAGCGGKPPVVSVIIPTYNRRELVRLAVDSVLAQTYSDYEIIVVDDGSTDGTAEALSRYGSELRYVHQQNAGESAARNHGIQLARGALIAFLDSDDLWLPDKLEKQVHLLQSDSKIGLVYCQAFPVDAKGWCYEREPLGAGQHRAHMSVADLVRSNLVTAGGSTAIVPRRCFKEAGYFDETLRFAEDWDMWLRLARNFSIRSVHEPLALVRFHPGSQRGWFPRPQEADRCFADHLRIIERVFANWPAGTSPPADVRAEVLAREHMRLAFVDYRRGRVEQARERLGGALRRWPDLICDPMTLRGYIFGRASIIGSEDPGGAGLACAQRYVDAVLHNLPVQLSAFELRANKIVAHVAIDLGFQYLRQGNLDRTQWYLWQGVRRDPAWGLNRGVLSILARAQLGLLKPGGSGTG